MNGGTREAPQPLSNIKSTFADNPASTQLRHITLGIGASVRASILRAT
jgi:hypothetical protein